MKRQQKSIAGGIFMTTMDKVNSTVKTAFNMMFDKEQLNYLEAAGLYGLTFAGRQNISALEIFYNHAQDKDLKALIKRAIDEQTAWLVDRAEKLIEAGDAKMPVVNFHRHKLHDTGINIPEDAKFTDAELCLALGNMAKASQTAVLFAMHQTYQPEIAMTYRRLLDAAFDFNYRLLQLTLENGWLPHLPKVEH
jgi:hypothetical protein